MTRARISLIFDSSVMFMSFQMVFSLFNSDDVCVMLDKISGFDRLTDMTAPRHVNLFTVSSFSPLTLMSVAMFVISLVFSVLISMLYDVDVLSRLSTKFSDSCPSPALSLIHI